MTRIKERELVIPALLTIKQHPGITTSDLITHLNDTLQPTGKDNENIKNRNDTHFSQKVRNLKSHDTLESYTEYSASGGWYIKPEGEAYLNNHEDQVKAYEDLLIKNFTYHEIIDFFEDIDRQIPKVSEEIDLYYYDEDIKIEEGAYTEATVKRRKRSKQLRDEAVKYYSDENNHIYCSICGFDYTSKYGELGKGFIEIHHKKPIYQYDDEDYQKLLKDAIKELMPLCANCHRMLHRDKDVSEEKLKQLVKENKFKK